MGNHWRTRCIVQREPSLACKNTRALGPLPCTAAASDGDSLHGAANGGAFPAMAERVMRRNPSPPRVGDAQADAFLRMREREEMAYTEQVCAGQVEGWKQTGSRVDC